MACCGRSVHRAVPAARPWGQPTEKADVLFEYRGVGALTVYGRTTGRRYHFPSGGARVHVDGRDAAVLEVTQGFARID